MGDIGSPTILAERRLLQILRDAAAGRLGPGASEEDIEALATKWYEGRRSRKPASETPVRRWQRERVARESRADLERMATRTMKTPAVADSRQTCFEQGKPWIYKPDDEPGVIVTEWPNAVVDRLTIDTGDRTRRWPDGTVVAQTEAEARTFPFWTWETAAPAMTLLDTSELRSRPQRNLLAAWFELQGRKVLVTQAVADELAPLAVEVKPGESVADQVLRSPPDNLHSSKKADLERQAWWAAQWRNPHSPYRIVTLDARQDALCEAIMDEIDEACFPATYADDILDSREVKIVAETLAIGGKLLMTRSIRTIDSVQVAEWVRLNAKGMGFRPEPPLLDGDATMLGWVAGKTELERWIQAGFLAFWPADDNAPARAVIEATMEGLKESVQPWDTRALWRAGGRLMNALEQHPDPEPLVEAVRKRLPSPTVESGRRYPAESRPRHRRRR